MTIKPNNSFSVDTVFLGRKRRAAADILNHTHRITQPLAKGACGQIEAISWEAAKQLIASHFIEIQARYGPGAIGVFGSDQMTDDTTIWLSNLLFITSGTKYFEINGRRCLSPAAASCDKAARKEIRALIVVGSKIIHSTLGLNQAQQRIRNLDFLVVCDSSLTGMAQMADIVLPLVKRTAEGTMTNLESRVFS
ncbi:MAG: molybdopterin-dependent oxidoreductase [Blastocatellia bacterium]|nr:molybdopterin-dependent oxidoreductase [Blastocatellia bacterium]